MVGGEIAAALLACQMAIQAYRKEEQRQEEERARRNNFYFNKGGRRYSETASQCNCETACPNEFTTGVYG